MMKSKEIRLKVMLLLSAICNHMAGLSVCIYGAFESSMFHVILGVITWIFGITVSMSLLCGATSKYKSTEEVASDEGA